MAYDATDFVVEAPVEVPTERKNMIALRDLLAAQPELFDYTNAWPDECACGTPVCLLGWGRNLSARKAESDVYAWMGLTYQEGNRLCFQASTFSGIPGREITGAHAVRVLDHYLATGKIDWKAALTPTVQTEGG